MKNNRKNRNLTFIREKNAIRTNARYLKGRRNVIRTCISIDDFDIEKNIDTIKEHIEKTSTNLSKKYKLPIVCNEMRIGMMNNDFVYNKKNIVFNYISKPFFKSKINIVKTL